MKYGIPILLAVAVILLQSVVQCHDWWENANFYQIYPRSFKDSDGDGIGDLKGVTEKLEYLKDIGFTAAWLSPIFKSPMADFGYDISDFYQVHPEYGTMEDFDNMMKKAKEIGFKIILDFVPNHSSDENEWFIKSVNGDPAYKDFYVWHDGRINASTGERQPPSNWVSVFRYSAWEWNNVRGQYYLHQFISKQPDLNYRNPAVANEMKNVLRFWLAKGISGFRVDAIPFLFEKELDRFNNYQDEPINSACPDPEDYCHLQHIYTNDQQETYDMMYQWRELADDFKKEHGGDTRILMTEAYTSFENIIRFYGDGKRNGSQVPFNFDLLSNLDNNTKAADIVEHVQKWLNAMPQGVHANWVLGNHDNKRLASRLGVKRADLFNILLQTLPGIAVTYNGEELAMTDVYISWDDSVDPQACNTNPETYYSVSRDPARTPFQWDASSYAGFTTGDHTWLPVANDFKQNNVLVQSRAPQSHLHIFKKLVRLRKEPSIQEGTLSIKAVSDNVIVYKREKTDSDVYVIVLNLGRTNQTINLNEHFPLGNKAEVITASIQSMHNDGEIVDPSKFMAQAEVGTVLVAVK